MDISLQRTAIKATMRIVALGSKLRQQPEQANWPPAREWTREEITILRKKYRFSTASEIAAHLSRSIPSVRAKVRALGLSKSRLTGKASRESSSGKNRHVRKRISRPGWKSKHASKRTSKRASSREKIVRKAPSHPVRPILKKRG